MKANNALYNKASVAKKSVGYLKDDTPAEDEEKWRGWFAGCLNTWGQITISIAQRRKIYSTFPHLSNSTLSSIPMLNLSEVYPLVSLH